MWMRINHKKPRKNPSSSVLLLWNVGGRGWGWGGENTGVSLVNRFYPRVAMRVLENCRLTSDPFYLRLVLYYFLAHFIKV